MPRPDDFNIEDLGQEPEDALENFDTKIAALQRQSEAVREEVGQATGVGRSSDGTVEVHARAGGQITSVVVNEKAMRSTPGQLGAAIQSAINRAQNAAAQASLSILTSFYGEDEATKQLKAVFVEEQEQDEAGREDGWGARPRYGYVDDEDEDPHDGRSWR